MHSSRNAVFNLGSCAPYCLGVFVCVPCHMMLRQEVFQPCVISLLAVAAIDVIPHCIQNIMPLCLPGLDISLEK